MVADSTPKSRTREIISKITMRNVAVMQTVARFGNAHVAPHLVQSIISHRVRDTWEEYLIKWMPNSTTGDSWTEDFAPYSWHNINELTGDENGNETALHLIQQYLDKRQKEKLAAKAKKAAVPNPEQIIGKKRKLEPAPGIPDTHRSPVSQLPVSREIDYSPSVSSAATPRSGSISSASVDHRNQDELDQYGNLNCTLTLKKGRITCQYLKDGPYLDTSGVPTIAMREEAKRATASQALNKIRDLFIRKLDIASKGRRDLTLVNTIDQFSPPLNFEFIDDYIYGQGVIKPEPDRVVGCTSCKPNMGGFCGCEYTKSCECLEFAQVNDTKLSDEERREFEIRAEGGAGTEGFFGPKDTGFGTMGLPKKFPYSKGTNLLVRSYLNSRYPIYECNEKCGCGTICKSRVVQNGRTVGLEIFKTKNRGWGLRAAADLLQGQFIELYTGEVITNEAAEDRLETVSDKSKDSYLFDLDKFEELCEEISGSGSRYTVDGEHMGGVTRFINHSCEPNCRQYAVSFDKNDPFVYKIAFFAIRYIPKGQELTFDYLDLDPGEDPAANLKPGDDPIPCMCGAKSCRKRLWK